MLGITRHSITENYHTCACIRREGPVVAAAVDLSLAAAAVPVCSCDEESERTDERRQMNHLLSGKLFSQSIVYRFYFCCRHIFFMLRSSHPPQYLRILSCLLDVIGSVECCELLAVLQAPMPRPRMHGGDVQA